MRHSRSLLTAVLVFVALAAPLLVMIHSFESWQRKAGVEAAQASAQVAANRVDQFLTDRTRSLHALAQSLKPEVIDEPHFLEMAALFDESLPGLQAVNWIDLDGTIRWVYPREPNLAALGKSVFDHPDAGGVLREVLTQETPAITPPIRLFQGVWGMACYLPAVDRSGPQPVQLGVVNGVFTIDRLVSLALEPELQAGFQVEVRDGDQLLYPMRDEDEIPAASPVDRAGAIVGQAEIEVLNRRWQLVMRPSPSSWIAMQAPMFTLARLVSLCLTLAVGVLAFFWLVRRAESQLARENAADMAERLTVAQKTEAVGRLAGGVAHDFNNLLTTVVGNASLLEARGTLDREDRQRLTSILHACDRATSLTSQLLAFSTHGTQEVRRSDLCAELKLLAPLLQAMIPAGIQLDVSCTCAECHLALAPSQLAQVLTNLISNAIDASGEQGQIQVRARSLAGQSLVLVVEDQGEGMDAETLARATEPFFTTKSDGLGTGLGLASVARIIHGAGGQLELESRPGRGTTVRMILPQIASGPATAAAQEPTRVAPGRVLVIEDKQSVREVTAALLEELGHEVTLAANSSEAFGFLAHDSDAFDLLLCDFQLPGTTGLEILKRARSYGVQAPAVLCSGYAENVRPEQLEALRAVFLPKPFGRDALLRAMNQAKARHQPTDEPARALTP